MNKVNGKKLTVVQAGSRGGKATLERRGRDFFSEIGRKGGKRTAQQYSSLLSEFGKKGGRPLNPNLDV
jgi:uncharacterized protein